MTDNELEKLIDKYEKKAQTARENYYATGNGRYNTACREAEDMAGVLSMAKNAKAEHEAFRELKQEVAKIAGAAAGRSQSPEAIAAELLNVCAKHGIHVGRG